MKKKKNTTAERPRPHRPGRLQRAILARMAEGQDLCRKEGWYLRHGGHGQRTPISGRAAEGLRDHGYVMFDRRLALEDADRYVITEQGKAAIGGGQ